MKRVCVALPLFACMAQVFPACAQTKGLAPGAAEIRATQRLTAMAAAYFALHNRRGAESWWIDTIMTTGSPDDRPARLEASLRAHDDLMRDMFVHHPATALANGVAKEYSHSFESGLMGGGTYMPFTTGGGKIRVAYYPKSMLTSMRGHLLTYHSALQEADGKVVRDIVIVAGIDWPRSMIRGLLVHELGHGYLHEIRKAAGKPDLLHGSGELDMEEVRMEEEMIASFDYDSKGAYSAQLLRTEKSIKAANWMEAISSIPLADLVSLDRILGLKPDGNGMVASNTLVRYWNGVGIAYINRHVAVKNRAAEKLKLYRLTVKIASTRWLS